MSWDDKRGRVWLALLTSVVLWTAAPAAAYDRSELEQRLAERRAQLEARRAEREAERAAREEETADVAAPDEACRCTAKLSFSKPGLQWRAGGLFFTPRINVSVRSRGEARTAWAARVDWEGETSYESAEVAVPSGVSFSGGETLFGGYCGDTYSYSGRPLPEVALAGLTRGLADDQEIDGRVQMRAVLSGCGEDEERRAFGFTLMDFGNLRVRGWRSAR